MILANLSRLDILIPLIRTSRSENTYIGVVEMHQGQTWSLGETALHSKDTAKLHSRGLSGPQRILLVMGTRPEAIKLAPVVLELRKSDRFEVKVCATAQHRQMLDQVLSLFCIVPDYDLDLMLPNQHLADLTARLLQGVHGVIRHWRPDMVLVQGDTSTTFAASLAAFYEGITIGHIEAGLRTGNLYAPWPEEANRKFTTLLATHHFAPTEWAKENLLREAVAPESIRVTGNTVIDALKEVLSRLSRQPDLPARYEQQFSFLDPSRRLILVTGHRRENFGEGLRNICFALRELSTRDDVELIYPVHLNPNVRRPVQEILHGCKHIHLIEPLEYEPFCYLLQRCYLIITDSGGIQEEATFLHKPVLLMRDTTERPEAVEVGSVKLVGTETRRIVEEAHRLFDDRNAYESMTSTGSPFGDGYAARCIVKYLETLKGVRCEADV
jgi:UDP-N-acetylglucosamine 2-epimerase (non-hydrolysing)